MRMLTHITTDRVRTIIHLADVAADAADRLANRMVKADVSREAQGGAMVHRSPRGDAELADLEPLRGSSMSEPLQRLEAAIGALSPEARQELHAIFLVGRGEFSAREWDEALEAAAARANEAEPRMLAERSSLGPQLSKGLYQLKLS
ncbi:MAG TPA: DUF3775 domain-containing protein [Acetobacteraceae bacterium]|nr:DUF3775 domain-containing protein [Acetobacteraceae bacterium]